MKLLYIQDSFGNGGINVVESIKENYLYKKGYEVYNLNVLNNRSFDGSFRYDEGIKKLYIENDTLTRLYKVPFIGILLRFVYYRIKLISIILKVNPDIIIASRDELEPFTVVLCTFWKKRILEFHCAMLDTNVKKYPLKKKLRTTIKYRFYNIVSLTKKDQEIRHNALKQKIYYIPNPLYQKPSEYSIQENKKILILARLCKQKNLPSLLNGWHKIQENHPDWSLDIYGEGDDKDIMLQIINRDNLSTVHMMGYTKEPLKIIPKYSFFLLPSLFEGFPMVLFECMGGGVPVIAYDCPCGPSEAITNYVDGILVPLGDMDTFIDKVNYLIDHQDVRKAMSLKCRESIKRYNLDVVMAQWENMFKSI